MSMYFDHARCPSCGAAFDPDKLSSRDGQPACPHCGAAMKLVDMFGIADAFAEDEPDQLTLDDLVPGEPDEFGPVDMGQRETAARPSPTAWSGSRTHRAVTHEDKERIMGRAEPSSENLPAAPARPGESAGAGSQTAADIMRELKSSKKK